MHLSTVVLLGSFAASAFAKTSTMVCAADNCLRAVRASAFPTRPGTADCSSYFITTVTPATSTTTVTPTNTVFNNKMRRDPDPLLVKRPAADRPAQPITVIPSAIPTYASACSGSVRYSSACSCIGVTGTTSTAATPIATETAAAVVVENTRPYINFQGYGDTSCSQDPTGPGQFVEGECTPLPVEISVGDEVLNPGVGCRDTSTCYINFYPSDDCGGGSPTQSVDATAQCIAMYFARSGMLVCPDC